MYNYLIEALAEEELLKEAIRAQAMKNIRKAKLDIMAEAQEYLKKHFKEKELEQLFSSPRRSYRVLKAMLGQAKAREVMRYIASALKRRGDKKSAKLISALIRSGRRAGARPGFIARHPWLSVGGAGLGGLGAGILAQHALSGNE